MSFTKKEIHKIIKENDVRYVNLWFTDILGMLKSFTIPVSELDQAMEEGSGFDGSSIDGFTRIQESDMIALPDPSTFKILPWQTNSTVVARMFCDVLTPDGTPYEGDPRYILRRNLKMAKDMGFTFNVGPELEYFYFENNKNPEPLDAGGYFDQMPLDLGTDLRKETINTLGELGLPVEASHHEVAPSQHEIALRYQDALKMADFVMTYKLVVKRIAYKHNKYATFMPKPLYSENGSGMHVHQSLFNADGNAFFDKKGDYLLSTTAKQFTAGILKHIKEFTLVTNQWINSYKRLVPGFEAPVYISWAQMNRSALVRIPKYKVGHEKATRIELRSPDPAANPYLAFAVMLRAGLEGIKKKYELKPPSDNNIYKMTEKERKDQGIGSIPDSLQTALYHFEKSELMKEALGEHVFFQLVYNKKVIWNEYITRVTPYEIDYYLPIL